MTLIPEEHSMMQFVLRFIMVLFLVDPKERSQKVQEFATAIAEREQRLVDALIAIEAHHVDLNAARGRDESHSYTLRVARAAIAKAKGEAQL